jgi:hypothetical protein
MSPWVLRVLDRATSSNIRPMGLLGAREPVPSSSQEWLFAIAPLLGPVFT